MDPKILFICGSLNQTSMMHKIASRLPEFECWFTPFYSEGLLNAVSKTRLVKHTILSGKHHQATNDYLRTQKFLIDIGGKKAHYDLVVTCTDLVVQSNVINSRLLLVQEGITEPEDFTFWLVKYLKMPRFLANTAATGLSNAYDKFCVASPGYRDFFIRKGVKPDKIIVTGIPNFDNAHEAQINDFPLHNYVLVATSSIRETGKPDNRLGFLNKVKHIAAGRQVVFKLHPNENIQRAQKEILSCIPDAIVFHDGNTNHMIANCDVLITQVSSVVYIGIALGKEVHSYFDLSMLHKLSPIQNNGTSANRIAEVCRNLVYIPLKQLRGSTRERPFARKWLPSGSE
jgi:hypothetical protein